MKGWGFLEQRHYLFLQTVIWDDSVPHSFLNSLVLFWSSKNRVKTFFPDRIFSLHIIVIRCCLIIIFKKKKKNIFTVVLQIMCPMIKPRITASRFQDKFILKNWNNNFQVTYYIFYHKNEGSGFGKFHIRDQLRKLTATYKIPNENDGVYYDSHFTSST